MNLKGFLGPCHCLAPFPGAVENKENNDLALPLFAPHTQPKFLSRHISHFEKLGVTRVMMLSYSKPNILVLWPPVVFSGIATPLTH